MAIPDITEAAKGAKVLIFVVPHQFIQRLCEQMKPHVTQGAIGISLIKVSSLEANSSVSWPRHPDELSPHGQICICHQNQIPSIMYWFCDCFTTVKMFCYYSLT